MLHVDPQGPARFNISTSKKISVINEGFCLLYHILYVPSVLIFESYHSSVKTVAYLSHTRLLVGLDNFDHPDDELNFSLI